MDSLRREVRILTVLIIVSSLTVVWSGAVAGWCASDGEWGRAVLNWLAVGLNIWAACSCNDSRRRALDAMLELWLNNKRLEAQNGKDTNS